MIKYGKLTTVLLLSWLISACASTSGPAVPNEYLLMDTSNTEQAINTPALDIQLLPVKVAPYLAGNNIILVSEQGEVHRSQQNLWAEPLAPQLHRLTLQRLSSQLSDMHFFGRSTEKSTTMYKLNIELNEFYADLTGKTHISGRWQLFAPSGKLITAKEFAAQSPLKSTGYPTLVNTLAASWVKDVVAAMPASIAEAIK